MPSRAVIKAAARAARQNNTVPAPTLGAGVSPMMAQYNSYGGALSYGNFLPRPPEEFADGGFSPLTPILPMGVDQPADGDERPEPRRFQVPVGWNMIQTPGTEGLGKLADFTTLRLIADYSSIARACIQLRKAEIRSLAWDIVPTRDAAKAMRGDRPAHVDFAARKAEALKFFRRPDPNYSDFSSWLDAVLEDIFVIDALSIYLHPARIKGKGLLGSDLAALALLDGSTVRPLLSLHGERPRPPAPAYSQYLYGAPRTDLMTVITGDDLDDLDQPAAKYRGDQLLYLPMNPRDWSPYGQAPAERCIVPIMASLQRQQWQANYFQEGTVPSVFVSPGDENMTPGQIATLQGALNGIAGDPAWKHKIIVLPGGSRVDPMHVTELADQFDEVIAVQVCMGYDVMPMELGISPKVSATQSSGAANQMAKASQSINQRKSLKPLLAFLKSTIFDMALQDICGQPDMQWYWEGLEEGEDEESKTNILMTQVNAGFRSHDEARLELGLEPWGLPITSDPGVMTPQGFVPLGAIDPQTGMPSAQQPALPAEAGEVSPPAPPVDAAGTPSHAGASAAVAEHDTQGPNQAAKPAGTSTKNASGYALSARSGMISLDVPDGIIEPVPGGVTDHHVTVVYLGWDVNDDALALACDRARSAAASAKGPVTAVLAGIDSFEPSPGSDGKVPAFIPVVSPGIEALGSALRDLSASEHTEFHPHVTLAYLDQDDPLPDPVEPVRVTFTELSVHRGDDVVRIPFGDASPGARQGGPSRKAALAELDALGRHLKKGRRITTWVSRHLPAVTLATVSEDLAKGLTVDEAVMVARSTLPSGGDDQEGEQPAGKTSRWHWPGWDIDQRLAADYTDQIQAALSGVFDAATAARVAGAWLQVASSGQSAQTWLQWNEPGLTDTVIAALRPVLTGLWRQAWTVGHAASQAVLDGKHHVNWSKITRGVVKAGHGGIDASAMVYDQQSLEDWLTHYGIAGISSIADTRMGELADLLESALEDGDSPDTLAAEIADLGASTDRATMIAITEIARAVSQAALANYEQAGVRQVSWLTVAGACKLCSQNESVGAIRLGDSFPSGADAPPGHPNCFPAGVLVSGGPIVAATARHYEGDLATIVFASGKEVPVTPNHPVLTTDGWVAAGDLHEGCEVLRAIDMERVANLVYPDDRQAVSRIEDVARTLAETSPVSAHFVPLTPEDFHGDGAGDDQVEVVHVQWNTVGDPVPEVGEHRSERGLIRTTRLPRSTSGMPDLLSTTNSPSTSRVMCSVEHARTLLAAGTSPSHLHRLRPVPAVDPGLAEHAVDGGPFEFVTGCERFHGLAGQERLNEVRRCGNPPLLRRTCASSERDIGGDEPLAKGFGADTANGRALRDRLSGLVSSDRVTEVRRIKWYGHVYNLETSDGWYFANGIIAHNCRCSLLPSSVDSVALPTISGLQDILGGTFTH